MSFSEKGLTVLIPVYAGLEGLERPSFVNPREIWQPSQEERELVENRQYIYMEVPSPEDHKIPRDPSSQGPYLQDPYPPDPSPENARISPTPSPENPKIQPAPATIDPKPAVPEAMTVMPCEVEGCSQIFTNKSDYK
jgi:hypothetical protein